MGCFDSVCSISNMPIQDGDDCVMVFVGARRDSGYGSIKYMPISFPIFGKYNDYGDLDNIDEDSVGWKIIQRLIVDFFAGVTLPTGRRDEPWEVFKDNISNGSTQLLPDSWIFTFSHQKAIFEVEEPRSFAPDKVTYNQVQGNGSVVEKLLIHRGVYDHLISTFTNSVYGWKSDSPNISEYLKDIPEYVKEIAKRESVLKEYDEADDDGQDEVLEKYNITNEFQLYNYMNNALTLVTDDTDEDDKFSPDNSHPLVLMMKGDRDTTPFYFEARRVLVEIIKELCRKDDLTEAMDFVGAFAETFCLVQGAEMHNMNLTPYTGHAYDQSQGSDGAERMIKYFEACATFQKVKLARFEKEWEE